MQFPQKPVLYLLGYAIKKINLAPVSFAFKFPLPIKLLLSLAHLRKNLNCRSISNSSGKKNYFYFLQPKFQCYVDGNSSIDDQTVEVGIFVRSQPSL